MRSDRIRQYKMRIAGWLARQLGPRGYQYLDLLYEKVRSIQLATALSFANETLRSSDSTARWYNELNAGLWQEKLFGSPFGAEHPLTIAITGKWGSGKSSLITADDYTAGALVRLEHVQGVQEFSHRFTIEGVHGLGSIDLYQAHLALLSHQNIFKDCGRRLL